MQLNVANFTVRQLLKRKKISPKNGQNMKFYSSEIKLILLSNMSPGSNCAMYIRHQFYTQKQFSNLNRQAAVRCFFPILLIAQAWAVMSHALKRGWEKTIDCWMYVCLSIQPYFLSKTVSICYHKLRFSVAWAQIWASFVCLYPSHSNAPLGCSPSGAG